MIARAPGKVVLSGAYAVLEGAPSIVSAVDRYVTAGGFRAATFVTPEVSVALGDAAAPYFDASPLRSGDKKLGLGSSAAILVASLGVIELIRRGTELSDAELCEAVVDRAIVAHRTAQGGGSGIDVAASAHGGTLVARRSGDALDVRPVTLPPTLSVEVLFAGVPASTPELVGRVRRLKADAPSEYGAFMDTLSRAAEEAVRAIDAGSASAFIDALRAQRAGFEGLGELAGAPIVTPEVRRLAAIADSEGGTVLPAGAGGGDVAVFYGAAPPSEALLAAIAAERHEPLGLRLGARGLHAAGHRP